MLPPFFGGSHCQPGCTHPFSEAAAPESGGVSGEVLSRRPWPKTFDHGLNDDLIGHCRCLSSQPQEPSDIHLQVLLLVLRTLKESLGSDQLRLKTLKAGH